MGRDNYGKLLILSHKVFTLFFIVIYFPCTALANNDLPGDPGELGKKTLRGIDTNGNGVRDDIERYIAFKYPNNKNLRKALHKYARITQKQIANKNDRDQVVKMHKLLFHTSSCVMKYGKERGILIDLASEFANTLERVRATIDVMKQLNGETFSVPPFSCSY